MTAGSSRDLAPMETAGLLACFEQMARIRATEEAILRLHQRGEVIGSVHLCIGQEAIPVGACAALRSADPVYATYRGHGWALARGVEVDALLAEVCGRVGGTNAGRGGSAYLSAPGRRFMGENSIVGAGAPIAVGAALAARRAADPWVTVTSFGDGAMNQGAVHEALNLAAAMSLPVVFVCENNRYSELTPIDEMVAEPQLYRRAAGYGIPGERVDGNDVAAVRSAVAAAADRAHRGHGPTLLECMTQRLVGHYIGDAETYRPAGELEAARADEPLVRARAELVRGGIAERVLDGVHRAVEDEIRAIADDVVSRPHAEPGRIGDDLYAS